MTTQFRRPRTFDPAICARLMFQRRVDKWFAYNSRRFTAERQYFLIQLPQRAAKAFTVSHAFYLATGQVVAAKLEDGKYVPGDRELTSARRSEAAKAMAIA